MNSLHSKTKILICIDDLAVGGTQHQLVRQLAHFDRELFEFHIIAMCTCTSKTIYGLLPNDVTVHTLSFSGFFDLREWLSLLRLIKKIRPDLIMSSLSLSNSVVRILYPLHHVPVISREHNVYLHRHKRQIFLDRMLAPIAKTIVTVSKEVADFTSTQERIPRKRFTVINNGIDISEVDLQMQTVTGVEVKKMLNLGPDTRVAVFVGRLIPQKGLELMLRGFSLFSHNHTNWRLVIVGHGHMEKDLLSLAFTLGISNVVYFVGEQKNVHQYYAVADCLISTSTSEGMSNVHLEALAHGVPIVTTKTGGTGAIIIEGETGFFIAGSTDMDVCDALVRFDQADHAAMRLACLSHRNSFDIKHTVQVYQKLFKKYALFSQPK